LALIAVVLGRGCDTVVTVELGALVDVVAGVEVVDEEVEVVAVPQAATINDSAINPDTTTPRVLPFILSLLFFDKPDVSFLAIKLNEFSGGFPGLERTF